eukprot:TRINITY_DN3460_c0_g2_i1.p1 TRINITY_DN3460_c0_g2~~TRINITY_DN3460_c0_g2_i1.p1  ORF type:complete len:396 (+),score=124.77 TRINITY_DN3460_c0_g2_i1:46-1188(+)
MACAEKTDASCWELIKEHFITQHLLIFLAIAFVWGLAWPKPGASLEYYSFTFVGNEMGVVSSINIMVIFFINGLRLKTDDVVKALKAPVPILASLLGILVVTPAVGFLPANINMGVDEFSIGFALFCCVPTTLTAAAALVAQGAPEATVFALLLSVVSNLLGAVTVPFALKLVLNGLKVKLEAVKMILKLILVLLIPSAAGKVLTVTVKQAAVLTARFKIPLTLISNANLAMMVWMSLSKSQSIIIKQSAGTIFGAIGAAITLHLMFWLINCLIYFVPYPFVPHKDYARAVWILNSQKALPVALAIIYGLDSSVGETGLLALPCIFSYLAQLLMDSAVINYWMSKDKKVADFAGGDDIEKQKHMGTEGSEPDLTDFKDKV